MELSKNWLTEHLIDFEYKKYQLLGYLQQVKDNYQHTRVYPWLAEVIDHYKNLVSVRKNSEELKGGFQKDLKGFNFAEMKLEYEATAEENELMQEIIQIIDFSIPLFAQHINEGKTIYDFVEDKLQLKAIGITPLKTDEGYLFLHCRDQQEVHVYQYHLSFYSLSDEKMRSIITTYNSVRELNFSYSYEKLKHDLIAENRELPNPAVYAIDCALTVPLNETLLPIAKRYFVSRIAA
ncbi:MAG: hypothetical protein IAF38_00855 [Bacteroidia bacterium]|nr:hypothetical protein [Bacteroidia bacterium]